MQISIVAVGRKPPAWIQAGVEEYRKRITGTLSLNILEVAAVKRGKSISTKKLLAAEAERIRAAIPAGSLFIALDEHGREFTTGTLATQLADWIRDAQDISFVIGGADGMDQNLLAEAWQTWALSKLTLPHALVRVLLAEQIYRAWSILKNHPYHRS